MRKDYTESKDVCFLRNDYEHVYWRCANLYGDGIVVMDSKEDYYLVDPNLKKTYIGCNNPKNENEDLKVVMPRLGKNTIMRQCCKRRKWKQTRCFFCMRSQRQDMWNCIKPEKMGCEGRW